MYRRIIKNKAAHSQMSRILTAMYSYVLHIGIADSTQQTSTK